jgi:hypothetical protein
METKAKEGTVRDISFKTRYFVQRFRTDVLCYHAGPGRVDMVVGVSMQIRYELT